MELGWGIFWLGQIRYELSMSKEGKVGGGGIFWVDGGGRFFFSITYFPTTWSFSNKVLLKRKNAWSSKILMVTESKWIFQANSQF